MRNFVLLVLLVFCQSMFAGLRTESRMRKIAASKLMGSAKAASEMNVLKSTPSYNIYGRGNGKKGFVIVSADDNASPVLGYSSTEYIEDEMPPAFKCWLKAVEASSFSQEVTTTYKATPNFLPSTWGQSDPFNYLCPEIDGVKVPCGCVATAMSQIMYYYQYPSHGVGNGYYTFGDALSARYPDEIKGIYQWEMMKPMYSSSTITEEERLAVAVLLKDAGLATYMQYASDGSGAAVNDAALAFVNNFSYDANTICYMLKDFYTNVEWNNIIYEELAAQRPILVGGQDPVSGGHAFVFSGVDEDGKVYVNWGWNGSGDGFYEITALNPPSSSGSGNTFAFNFDNEMICGIQPAQSEPDESLRYSIWACEEPFVAEYQKIRNWLKVKTSLIYNISMYPFTGEIKLYCESVDGDETKDKSYTFLDFSQDVFPSRYGSSDETKTIKTTDLDPGKYYIYLISQAVGESSPQKVRSSGGLIIRYIMTKAASGQLTIEDDDALITRIESQSATYPSSSAIYDLSGRRIQNPTKGIYIVDGKKIVTK